MNIQTNQLGNIYLTPEEGYKYITNNEIFSTMVYVPNETVIANWHDTNDEPPHDPETQEIANVVEDAYTLGTEVIGG